MWTRLTTNVHIVIAVYCQSGNFNLQYILLPFLGNFVHAEITNECFFFLPVVTTKLATIISL